MAEPNNILDCPFCGYKGSLTQYGCRPEIWCVECSTCGAEGGRQPTPESAVTAWNCRAVDPKRDAKDSKAVGCSAWLDELRAALRSNEALVNRATEEGRHDLNRIIVRSGIQLLKAIETERSHSSNAALTDAGAEPCSKRAEKAE